MRATWRIKSTTYSLLSPLTSFPWRCRAPRGCHASRVFGHRESSLPSSPIPTLPPPAPLHLLSRSSRHHATPPPPTLSLPCTPTHTSTQGTYIPSHPFHLFQSPNGTLWWVLPRTSLPVQGPKSARAYSFTELQFGVLLRSGFAVKFSLKCFGLLLRRTQFDVLVWCCFTEDSVRCASLVICAEGTQFHVVLWPVVPPSCFRDTCWRGGLCTAGGTLWGKATSRGRCSGYVFWHVCRLLGQCTLVMSRILRGD